MSQEQQQQPSLHDLVQDADLTTPLHELVEDPALLDQPIEIDPQELERLEMLAQEYLQELHEQGLLPDAPPMDIDPQLLEPTKQIDREIDFGR